MTIGASFIQGSVHSQFTLRALCVGSHEGDQRAQQARAAHSPQLASSMNFRRAQAREISIRASKNSFQKQHTGSVSLRRSHGVLSEFSLSQGEIVDVVDVESARDFSLTVKY